ncbi:MAG TPA: hypothetical protein VFE78_22235 [Gemmataceae bacterium]|nr:hypothetical protein [Gemmataceae bacterium]
MLFHSLFRHLALGCGRGRARCRLVGRTPRGLPRLEALEDRTAPAMLTVTSAADDGSAGTLRAVLASAGSGDTVRFARRLDGQTITLTQGQLTVSQSLDIDGPGADDLTISGNAAGRIFAVGAGTAVSISGLTLTHGLATDGAAVLNAGNLTLADDVLRANVAQGAPAGGLFGDGGGRGGAVENQAGAALAVQHSLFAGNQALGGAGGGNAFGGAVYNEAGAVTIDASRFAGNQAVAGDGGAVGVAATLPGGVSATLLGVGAGGGVWNDGGSLDVTDSALSDNLARGGDNGDARASTARFVVVGTATGGAVGSGAFFTTATPALLIGGSTLSDNQSQGGTNVTVGAITGNDAGNGHGGAVGAVAGNVTVADSTIRGNMAEGGALFTIIRGGSAFQSTASTAVGGGLDDEYNLGFSLTFPGTASAALSITDTSVRDNVALGNGPSGSATGGGVASNLVNAQLTDSTVSDNQALGSPGGGFFTSGRTVEPANGGAVQGGGVACFQGSLSVTGCAVNDNLAQGGVGGTPGAGSGFGGASTGGGIDFSGPSFVLTGSSLRGNRAVSGDATAGNGFFAATGSNASRAGGLAMTATAATVSDTTFVDNLARGGTGMGSFGGAATAGGALLAGGSLQLTGCAFIGNHALGGGGGVGSSGPAGARGGGGTAGGLETTVTTATISDTNFVRNVARGGAGGDAVTGGTRGGIGGGGAGGALVNQPANSFASATTTLIGCTFVRNVAQGAAGGTGGAGAAGGAGGNGGGGALLNSIVTFVLPTLNVTGCTFVRNVAEGGAGTAGGAGGSASGGGASEIAALTLADSSFTGNQARGGAGGAGSNGGPGGPGGPGMGGGLALPLGSTATVRNTQFAHDVARGGMGGAGDTGGAGGAGGAGEGGALANALSTTAVSGSSFLLDAAEGGAGGRGGAGANGGQGGAGLGGAAYNVLVNGFGAFAEVASLTVGDSSVTLNRAVGGDGGAGGVGGVGGAGGNGEGGGLFDSRNGFTGQATVTVSGSFVLANAAEGGAGAGGANGGNGLGGGAFIDVGATGAVLTSVVTGNQADGGAAGAGGSAGQGVGGGVYNLGTFDLDAASVIVGNHASTSNDDIFGPVTPV